MPRHWLIKSEPETYSIDDLRQDKKVPWDGVRNYQARNFMRDQMKIGDLALFYHSNAEPPGIAGLARVSGPARPDVTALDPKDSHYDPKSTPEKPVWMMVEFAFVEKFSRFVSLNDLRSDPRFKDMMVLQKGSRLSIQPVDATHFDAIVALGRSKPRKDS